MYPDGIISAYLSESRELPRHLIFEKHCHTYFELVCVLDGEVEITVESRRYRLSEGAAIVLLPMQYHIVVGAKEKYRRLIVSFDGTAVPDAIAERFREAVARDPVFDPGAGNDLIERLAAAAEMTPKETYGALLRSLLVQLFYGYVGERKSGGAGFAGENTVLERLLSYINAHLCEDLSLEKLSAELYLSTSSISHVFKKEMNLSVKQYILEKRMRLAETLIRSGETPTRAAVSVGYRNYSAFYKQFRRLTGMSPNDTKA